DAKLARGTIEPLAEQPPDIGGQKRDIVFHVLPIIAVLGKVNLRDGACKAAPARFPASAERRFVERAQLAAVQAGALLAQQVAGGGADLEM
ncbi:hypothetical protein ABTM19_19970, partial [Acinetobacter baumannii]